jgi:hypothetical protein
MTNRNGPDDSNKSLRAPPAAIANVLEKLGEEEPNELCRAQRRREARKLRELARNEPLPKR